jgi:hypothetical protein
MQRAFSERVGVNWITTIIATDGYFVTVNDIPANPLIIPKGTTKKNALIQLINAYPISPITGKSVVSVNQVSKFLNSAGQQEVLLSDISVDRITDVIIGLVGNNAFFIDLGLANVLLNNEAIEGTLTTLNSNTGLLGTPMLESTMLYQELVFEPRIIAGQSIVLNSPLTVYNGKWKVQSIKHSGVISGSIGGGAITVLGLFDFENNQVLLT